MAGRKAEEQAGGAAVEEPDEEKIRRRAFELSQEEGAGSPDENWQRAEEELRGGSADPGT